MSWIYWKELMKTLQCRMPLIHREALEFYEQMGRAEWIKQCCAAVCKVDWNDNQGLSYCGIRKAKGG